MSVDWISIPSLRISMILMHFSCPMSAEYGPVEPSPLTLCCIHWDFPHLLIYRKIHLSLGCTQPCIVLPSCSLEAALFSQISYSGWKPRINSKFPTVVIKCLLLSEDLGSGLPEAAQQVEIRWKKITQCPQHSSALLIPLPVYREWGQQSISRAVVLGKSWAGGCAEQETGSLERRIYVFGCCTEESQVQLFRGPCCFLGTAP